MRNRHRHCKWLLRALIKPNRFAVYYLEGALAFCNPEHLLFQNRWETSKLLKFLLQITFKASLTKVPRVNTNRQRKPGTGLSFFFVCVIRGCHSKQQKGHLSGNTQLSPLLSCFKVLQPSDKVSVPGISTHLSNVAEHRLRDVKGYFADKQHNTVLFFQHLANTQKENRGKTKDLRRSIFISLPQQLYEHITVQLIKAWTYFFSFITFQSRKARGSFFTLKHQNKMYLV